MFEVYAAQIEYQHAVEQRDRDLRLRALRLGRSERDASPPVRRVRRAPRAWPRPIVLHASAVA
jgi:hypothetical protein